MDIFSLTLNIILEVLNKTQYICDEPPITNEQFFFLHPITGTMGSNNNKITCACLRFASDFIHLEAYNN